MLGKLNVSKHGTAAEEPLNQDQQQPLLLPKVPCTLGRLSQDKKYQ
jgi:hypothetical protein